MLLEISIYRHNNLAITFKNLPLPFQCQGKEWVITTLKTNFLVIFLTKKISSWDWPDKTLFQFLKKSRYFSHVAWHLDNWENSWLPLASTLNWEDLQLLNVKPSWTASKKRVLVQNKFNLLMKIILYKTWTIQLFCN
jgi:hypothetical protein